MLRQLRFTVKGIPRPKGSFAPYVRPDGTPSLLQDNKHTKAWERAVRLAATRAVAEDGRPDWPIDAPVEVELYFQLPRPKKPKFDVPATKPDWDKLARSTCDPLSKICIADDARIVSALVELGYCRDGARPGAVIIIREVEL